MKIASKNLDVIFKSPQIRRTVFRCDFHHILYFSGKNEKVIKTEPSSKN